MMLNQFINHKFILVICLFVCNIVFASEVMTGFEEKDLPAWNERLRKLRSDIDTAEKNACWIIFESDEDVATGNGTLALTISPALGGTNLVNAVASVHTKGVTNTTDIQIRRRRAGVNVDMLSTKITIGDEYYVSDEVIDTGKNDIEEGDQLYIDVDAIHTTTPKGLSVTCTFKKLP